MIRLPLWFALELAPDRLAFIEQKIVTIRDEIRVAEARVQQIPGDALTYDADELPHLENKIQQLQSDLHWYRGGVVILTESPETIQVLDEFHRLYQDLTEIRLATMADLEQLLAADKPGENWSGTDIQFFRLWQKLQELAVPIIRKTAALAATASAAA